MTMSVIREILEDTLTGTPPDQQFGFLPLNAPTGMGKTHEVVHFLHNHWRPFAEQNRQMIYISTQIKYLPHERLKDLFQQHGEADLFDQNVLLVSNNQDAFLHNRDCIPPEVKEMSEYKDLSDLTDASQGAHRNEVDRTLQSFRTRVFQYYLKAQFRDQWGIDVTTDAGHQEALQTIRREPELQWVRRVFPAVLIPVMPIIFLTLKKFLYPISRFFRESYEMSENLRQGTVVFMDEVDHAKNDILEILLQRAGKSAFPLIETFRHICAKAHYSVFKDSLYNTPEIIAQRQRIRSLITEVFDENGVAQPFYCKDLEPENDIFLFHSHRFDLLLDEKQNPAEGKKVLAVEKTPETNHIHLIDDFDEEQRPDLVSLRLVLSRLARALETFVGQLQALSQMVLKIEAPRGFTESEALETVLDAFGLKREDWLKDALCRQRRRHKGSTHARYSSSFHDRGFRIFIMQNDFHHNMQTRIECAICEETPESFLARLCGRALVIGTSATALHDSVYTNFDLGYLRTKLGHAYRHISQKHQLQLQEEIDASWPDHDRPPSLSVQVLGHRQTAVSNPFDTDPAHVLENLLQGHLLQKLNDYYRKRLLLLMEAIEYFISKGHRAGLCLLNHNHKVSSGDDAGIEDIKELTQKIAETLNQPAPDLIFKNATVVNGKLEPRAPGPNPEDERIREQLITGLHAGRRVLVITAYPTLGRGVNIDHSPSPDEVLHTIGKRFRLDTVDLDFLYLVKKTNIIPNIYNHGSGSALKKEDKLSLTYYAQALAEKGELSAQDCYRKTKSVWTGNKKDFARGIYNGPDFAWSQMESTTQGVGRLSRSDRKRPHTSVLLDPELAQALGPCRELPEDFMVSVPMSKILEASPPHTSAPDEDRLMRRAQNQTGKISKAIRDLLRAAQKGRKGHGSSGWSCERIASLSPVVTSWRTFPPLSAPIIWSCRNRPPPSPANSSPIPEPSIPVTSAPSSASRFSSWTAGTPA